MSYTLLQLLILKFGEHKANELFKSIIVDCIKKGITKEYIQEVLNKINISLSDDEARKVVNEINQNIGEFIDKELKAREEISKELSKKNEYWSNL